MRRGLFPLGGVAQRSVGRLARARTSTHLAAYTSNPALERWTSGDVYEPTRLPIDEASTLPGDVYSDATFHKLEKERLFASSWVAVAELCDISSPGDVTPSQVADSPIILANYKGSIRAFHNVCSHRAAKLVHEKCSKRKTILCPYHRWGYSLDGRLMGTPSFDADENGKSVPEGLRDKFKTHHVKNFDKASMGLKPVRVECAFGLAFVNLNGEAPPLREWLGDLVPWLEDYEEALKCGELIGTHRKSYDIAANWKLLIENFLEYYHLPAVHPALCDVSGVDEHQRFQGRGCYMGFATHPLTKGGTAIDPGRLPPFPPIRAHRHQSAYHISIFPNVFFSLYPDAFFRVRLAPSATDPNRTIEHATLQTHKGALEAPDSEKILQEIFEFWDNVNAEDIAICENVQQGVSSPGYTRGRFSFRFEEPLHRFQNMVIDKMIGEEEVRYRVPEGDVETTFVDLPERRVEDLPVRKASSVQHEAAMHMTA